MEEQKIFGPLISNLNKNLSTVYISWKDQTALSFLVMNDKITNYLYLIEDIFNENIKYYKMAENGYDESEINDLISRFASQVSEA